MTRDELYKALVPIIKAATGVPIIIPADDNKPAPNGPYAALESQQTISQRGQASIKRAFDGNGRVTKSVSTNMVVECAIDFYRGDARGMAGKLREANKRPSISMALMRAGIGWGGVGVINNLTALQSDQHEQRAQATFTILYTDTVVDELGAIEYVPVSVIDDKGREVADFKVDTRKPVEPPYSLTFGGKYLTFTGSYLTFKPVQAIPDEALTVDGLPLLFDDEYLLYEADA